MSNNNPNPDDNGVRVGSVSSYKCAKCDAVFDSDSHPNPLRAYTEHVSSEHGGAVRAAARAPEDSHTADPDTDADVASSSSSPTRGRAVDATKRVGKSARKAGHGAKVGTLASISYLFDEQGERVATGWGLFLGLYWGAVSKPEALALIAATAGGGLAGHELVRKFPGDTQRLAKQVQRNLLQCGLGLFFAALTIVLLQSGFFAGFNLPSPEQLFDAALEILESPEAVETSTPPPNESTTGP